MRISIAIMASFERREHAQALRDQLNRMWFVDPYIIYDDELYDNPKDNEWRTGTRALIHGIGRADWHVVLQDDAIINEYFYEKLYLALASVPERSLVSLYLGRVKPHADKVTSAFRRASACDASWITDSNLWWGVGIAIPTQDIVSVLDAAILVPHLLYDRRIGNYYRVNRRKIYYTTVSLVDHNDELPSLTGHKTDGRPRVAHKFMGEDFAPLNNNCIAM